MLLGSGMMIMSRESGIMSPESPGAGAPGQSWRGKHAMFTDFVKAVDKALQHAAFFRKADLHVHSYESHDFPRKMPGAPGDPIPASAYKVSTPQDFLAGARLGERGLDIVAITDHNKCRAACQIAAELTGGRLVLPGVEISVQCTELAPDSVHLVAIFPRKTASEDIEQIFLYSGMPPYDERDETAKVTSLQVSELLKRIHDAGGICIAAHVNTEGGLREYVRARNVESLSMRREIARLSARQDRTHDEEGRLDALKQQQADVDNELQERLLRFLTQAQFDAVQIQKPMDAQHYAALHCSPLGIQPIACVLCSDAHSPSDVGMRGHTTYLRMGEVSLEGVRRALQDPLTRIRFEEEKGANTIMAGVHFGPADAAEDGVGFFRRETIGFADNLTCLIGGRGAGKSAVIDALRFAFMLPLDAIEENRLRVDVERRQAKTLAGTEVRVLLRRPDGQALVLTRRYEGPDSPPTQCFRVDGRETDVDVGSSNWTRIRLFGWSEIEALATDCAKQRRLLDAFVPELEPLKAAREDQLEALRANTDEILREVRGTRSLIPKVTELPDLRRELRIIETPEMQAVFEEVDAARKGAAILREGIGKLDEIEAWFLDAAGDQHDVESAIRGWLTGAIEALDEHEIEGEALAGKSDEIRTLAAQARREYGKLLGSIARIRQILEAQSDPIGKALDTAKGTLLEKARSIYGEELERGDMREEDVVARVGERAKLNRRVSELERTQDQIEEGKRRVGELLDTRWTQLVEDLREARRTVSDKREENVRDINTRLGALSGRVSISVDLMPDGDRERFAVRLGADQAGEPGLLYRVRIRSWRESEYAQQIAQHLLPADFARAVIERDAAALGIDPGEQASGISVSHAERVIEHLSPFDDDEWYDDAGLEQLLRLQELEIEDRPVICLGEEPIEELSPGQRCTALVPIILLQGNEPLIIDQPEDNLDNRLVFDVVVDVLRSLKEERQVIAATHNPNIPVSGDAEQIVVLEAVSKKRGRATVQGSIDRDEVIKEVTDIMEGSEQAFELRAQKYGYDLRRRPGPHRDSP